MGQLQEIGIVIEDGEVGDDQYMKVVNEVDENKLDPGEVRVELLWIEGELCRRCER
ncbi:hypothetical protein [Haloarcula sp. 1CSR25-25]|uniref:hypothetical protein n=1 Tax=Haloarcula sp. 1CSR25-25 TaxID=2862545 RepID=UPI002893EBB6|nr:hypothetical protein [Haloarcula sp. 1CSR25-25]MDT3434670.1 hypothetical protein [Haloarcula sp. 1CSR25-25]